MKVKNYSAKNKRRDGKGSDVSQFSFDKRFLLSPNRAYYRHTNREVIAEELEHLRSLEDLRAIDGYFDCADEWETQRMVEDAFALESFGAEHLLMAHGWSRDEAMDAVWEERERRVAIELRRADRTWLMAEITQDIEEEASTREIASLMTERRAVALV